MPTRVKRQSAAATATLVDLPLEQLHMDPAIQPRVSLDFQTVTEYATLYQEADEANVLPPLDIFQLDARYEVVDGFHRVEAARQAERASLPCQVHQGSLQDAIRFAALANLKRGLPYSSRDRSQVLERLLTDPDVGQQSDRQLGALLGLSHMTVNRARHRLQHIATLTAEMETVAPPQAHSDVEAVATFLHVPLETVQTLARHHKPVERKRIVEEVATYMANASASAEEAKAHRAEGLTWWSEDLAKRAGEKPQRPYESKAAREARRADARRADGLRRFLATFEALIPAPLTPEELEAGDAYVPAPPKDSPADLVAGTERDILRRYTKKGFEVYAQEERAHLVQQLQHAYHVLDAFKAACVAQGWEVSF